MNPDPYRPYGEPQMTGIGKFPHVAVEFVCAECGKPGVGSRNAKVHAGECRRKWQNRINARLKQKGKRCAA